jgi:Na+/H+-translocating membrane pyrophosphatase
MILGASMARDANLNQNQKITFMFFPLAVHCLDIIASTVGIYYVRTKKGVPEYNMDYG